jgi:hypothetical protein
MSEPSWFAPLQLLQSFVGFPETQKAARKIAKDYLEKLGQTEPAEPVPVKRSRGGKQPIDDAIVAKAKALVASGVSMRDAADQTGIHYSTLQRKYKKRKYTKRKSSGTKAARGLPRPLPRANDGKFPK